MTGPAREVPPNLRGVWLAHHSDWSSFVVFRDELKCLRHAVRNSMNATFCPFGLDPRDVANDVAKTQPSPGGQPA